MPPDYYIFPGDPYDTVEEIFKLPFWGSWVPAEYNFAAGGDHWLYDFIFFLESAGIDPSGIPEEQLVYMALLYHTMDKEEVDWQKDVFILKKSDSSGAQLEIIFKFPVKRDGNTAVSVTYENGNDYVFLETSTTDKALIGPMNSMAYVLPDKDIVMWRTEFDYAMTEGAYKGLSAKFTFSYLLISPRDSFEPQKLYYSEQVDMTLPDADKDLDLGLDGSFTIPPYARVPMSGSARLEDYLPSLFQNAKDLKSNFGGTQKDESGWAIVVIAFGDKREQFDSFQQQLVNMLFLPDDREMHFRKLMDLAEGSGFQDMFIDEDKKVVQQSFNTLEEAKKAGANSLSRGYIVVVSGNDYLLFELTTSDLIWLAKKAREEEASDSARYDGMDLHAIEAAEFHELPISEKASIEDKMAALSQAYFLSETELHAKAHPYSVLYETRSGFYAYTTISEEEAAKLWLSMDAVNKVPFEIGLSSDENVFVNVQWEGIMVLPSGKGPRMPMIISHEYYEGRTAFVALMDELEGAKNTAQGMLIAKKLFEEPVMSYVLNSMMRPASWGVDPEIKRFIGSMSGKGDIAESMIGTFAFAVVSGTVEAKGIKMIEDMMVLLNMMADMDVVMKMMIASIHAKPANEQVGIAQLFTEDEDEARLFVAMLKDDEKRNTYLMGNEVNGFHVDAAAAKIKESRDEIKSFLDDRKSKNSGGASVMPYEEMFIVQKGELGDELRKETYNSLGFKLNHKNYPHSNHVNTSWFPDAFHEGGKDYTSLLEQAYINKAVSIDRTNDVLNAVKTVAMVAGVFSLARGAGLWAVGKLGIEGTKLAIVVEALATSIVAGFMLQGIKVAMGGEWSWEELGWTIGEAFVMMLTFGYVNSLFRLPITQFTVNALAFIGIGVGKFYLDHGRLPDGFEFNLIILESVLMITLLHIGTKLTDPFFRRLFKLHPFNPNLKLIQGDVQRITVELAKESAKKNPNKGKIKGLGEELFQQLKLYRKWIEKNVDKFTEAEVKAELEKLDGLIDSYLTAKLLDIAELSLVSQMESAFFYKPGTDSIDALKAKYGEDNVKIDPDTGIGKVKTPEGEFALIPESVATEAGAAGVKGEKLTDIFGDMVRMIDLGVYAMAPGAKARIIDYYLKKGGEWIEIGNDMYMARYPEGKGMRRLIFVEEAATVTVEMAIKMELKKQGAGIAFLRASLPTKPAMGLEILQLTTYKGKSGKFLLEALKRLEVKALADGKSLAQELRLIYEKMTPDQAARIVLARKSIKSAYRQLKKAKLGGKSLVEIYDFLTRAEISAIYEYTRSSEENNKALRFENPVPLKYRAMEIILNQALAKFPDVTGRVYRGAALTEKQIADLFGSKMGTAGPFIDKAPTSSSTDVDVGKHFADMMKGKFPDRKKVFFMIESKSGKYVDDISVYGKVFKYRPPVQEEVLFKTNARFEVRSIEADNVTMFGEPVTIIILRQL